jgi:Tfp pilus assembly protein PilN
MIQLNLMPDVKLQYIRARQRKRMVISVSVIATIFFIVIFIILFTYVRVAQTNHLKNLSTDITAKTNELKGKQDLNKILAIQSQLKSLPGLHEKKVVSSKLFDYLTKLTPEKATISDVKLDFKENKLIISGNASEVSTVNKFADTLKFTGFVSSEEDEVARANCALGKMEEKNPDNNSEKVICRAFSEVVLSEFDLGGTGQGVVKTDKPISYDLSFKFDPKIFANLKSADNQPVIALNVPKIISTRSITEKPGDLFSPQPVTNPEEEGFLVP